MHTLRRKEGILCHIGAVKDGNNLIMEVAVAATAVVVTVVATAAVTEIHLY